MNAICLVVDRLHIGHVGTYGNSWIETPEIDRLAAEAFVFDHALIDSPRLETLYQSYWQGHHPLSQTRPDKTHPTLARLLSTAGISTTLLTDDPRIARLQSAQDFDELVEIETPKGDKVAPDINHTQFARCFAQIIDWLNSARGPFLLWAHLTGMAGAWDAPWEFRSRYVEPGDPPPPPSALVPELILEEDYDPDRLLGICQVYSGQVSFLDTCVGALMEFLRAERMSAETLLVLSSARGFPLGEHRRVGACDDALYGELTQVPLLIRFPDSIGAAARSHALVEPLDLPVTLLDWWRVPDDLPVSVGKSLMPLVREEKGAVRDRLCIAGVNAEWAIRTPAWYLRNGNPPELFAKPDDRWEVNTVADRCHDVVDQLQEAFSQYRHFLQSSLTATLPPLNEILVSGLD